MSKYDWDKWTDGHIHFAREDEDFTCKPESFVRHLYLAAQHRGLSVECHALPTGKKTTLVFICFDFREKDPCRSKSIRLGAAN